MLQTEKLHKWAELLLDMGKRNNLICFKDSASTASILLPDFFGVFEKAEHGARAEVFDPDEQGSRRARADEEEDDDKHLSADEFLHKYRLNVKRNQILLYGGSRSPISAVKNIDKKARAAIEETGVNILYAALGFIEWFESDESQIKMRAPLLLTPVSIENRSAAEPFYVRFAEDEMIVNPTFAYKMRSDYGIELPEYDEDQGAMSYIGQVRDLIKKPGFSVLCECKIGLFSFQKINMYKDIEDNAQTILQNADIRALLGEPDEQEAADATQKEEASFVSMNVVDADSSQIEAIELAHTGKSFVLQGPPGTGKSQTITNIIAQRLADGKKVLFVSEKLAALNVVYEKLRAAGLDEFCLQLHSHKTNKHDVIDELCRTLRTPRSSVTADAARELDALAAARAELDTYTCELHKVRAPIDRSFYDLCEEAAKVRTAPDAEYIAEDIAAKGSAYLDEADNLLQRYASFVPSIGYDYKQNIWYGYRAGGSYASVAQAKKDLSDVARLCRALATQADIVAERYGTDTANSIERARAFAALFDLLDDCVFVTPRLLNFAAAQKATAAAAKLHALSDTVRAKKADIDRMYDEEIYSLDGKTLYKTLTRTYRGFFSRLFGGAYKKIIKQLRLYKKDGKKPKYREAVAYIEALAVYQAKTEEFRAEEAAVKELFDSDYIGVDTDFALLQTELARLNAIIATGAEFGEIALYTDERLTREIPRFHELTKAYKEAFASFGEAEARLYDLFDPAEYDIRKADLGDLLYKCEQCAENTDRLDNWCNFRQTLDALSRLDLRRFVDGAIAARVPAESMDAAFRKVFFAQWQDHVLHAVPALGSIDRIRHDDAVRQFCQKDKLGFDVNKAKIRAYLSGMRPDTDMVAKGSEIALLLHEGGKKRKQMGIRALLGKIGSLSRTLKPCFMMSPLSVSTYLGPDMKFDTVIFDEASQIFPQDAVGAIYRGKQLIVVGDCKQMPPTDFFHTVTDGDDEDIDDVADFESVLDLCATVMPQKRLRWHYRSRYESLIAFSNKNFYDGELITFPSAAEKAKDAGVNYVYVDGVFDRKSRSNRAEAEKIADLVWKHIDEHPDRSLGVVAFGGTQQNLIDRVISKRRQLDPSKEEFFRADKEEPFFVKNLETVQGDERDTILLDVAYGRDAAGKLLLNFGPINREGGERRLNVAVTRAKQNVVVVSGLHATDIDLSRAGSRGARLLREYLDYAEFGEIALSRALTVNRYEVYDSEFEEEVCDWLRECGFSVDTQVGCSSFKIDMAVKRADTSDYVLAVECDGASYHSSASARDRDRLRQEVLERMGWRFYRIWSTDWFRNKRTEKERLRAAVRAALQSGGVPVSRQSEPAVFETEAQEERFAFPVYRMADIETLRKTARDMRTLVRQIAEIEAPIAEEWLLKRIAYLYGRDKVTSVVSRRFEQDMAGCERDGIWRRKGFLYIWDREIPPMRVPQEGSEPRPVKYIAPEELRNGLREVIARNVRADKNGLYKLLANRLGFARVTESIVARFDAALALLGDEVERDGEFLSVKNANK